MSWWNKKNSIAWLLWPFSLLFMMIIFFRKFFYKINLIKSHKFSCPIIIIGNIYLGGTGKTPLVIALVNYLKAQGYRPAVIARGYKAQAGARPKLIASDDKAIVAGDEPLLIKKTCDVPVVIDHDRCRAVAFLLKNDLANIIISDDGLQHYKLQRDIEIAVVDAKRQQGNGFCLPAGPLREPVSRLNSVDIIVVNGGKSPDNFTMQLKPSRLVNLLDSNQIGNVNALKKQTIHAVAGIGHPQRFFDLLTQQGLTVVPHVYPDHHRFKPDDLVFNDDLPVLMTAKDAVKCLDFSKPNWWYLTVTAELSAQFYQDFSAKLSEITHEKQI